MTEQDIVDKVRAILNDLGESESLTLLSEDTVRLEEYIRSAIPDAVLVVQQNSPRLCVNPKSGTATATVVDTATGFVTVAVPSDYVRLVSLKMSAWNRAAVQSYGYGSEEWKHQQNSVTRSGADNPVVTDGYGGDGKHRLETYTPDTSKTVVDSFVYEARYDAGKGLENLTGGDDLASAVCYMTASLVCRYFENRDTAEDLAKVAMGLVPQ